MPLPAYYSLGSGAPVVLLHATLSSKSQWKGLSSLLSERFRVIAVDLCGYGETPLPEDAAPSPFTLRDEAEPVRLLLDRLLGTDAPFHLVGHSYGGAVALALCHYYPRRVRTLCAVEPVAFHLLDPGEPDLAPLLGLAQSLDLLTAQGKLREAAQLFLDYWGGAGTFEGYPPRLQEEFAARTPKLRLDFQAITRTPITVDDYRTLRLPVRLIAGSRSRPSALLVTGILSRTLPNCTVHTVAAGHLAPLTHPQLVNPLILESLS